MPYAERRSNAQLVAIVDHGLANFHLGRNDTRYYPGGFKKMAADLNAKYHGTEWEGSFTAGNCGRAWKNDPRLGKTKIFPPSPPKPVPENVQENVPENVPEPNLEPFKVKPPVPDAVGCFWDRLDALSLDVSKVMVKVSEVADHFKKLDRALGTWLSMVEGKMDTARADLVQHRKHTAAEFELVTTTLDQIRKMTLAVANEWKVKP